MADLSRSWIEVDLEAIRDNARTVLRRVGGARLMPMIKADAYGLGAVPVARALAPLEPWGFGVVTAEEGRQLREGGVAERIVVIQPTMGMLERCAKHGLTPGLSSAQEVAAWRALAGASPFHVQVDTGMNRGGIWWETFASEAAAFAHSPGLEGVFTHFHSAESDPASVKAQWERFHAALASLPRRPVLSYAANSAASLLHPETAGDIVRPGIFLYGGVVGTWKPRRVVSWRARVARVAWREAGTSVSYGATYRTAERACVVSLAVGYADVYRRALSNRGEVLIEGRRWPVAGTVTMDHVMVARAADAPVENAVATLVGSDGGEEITLESVAALAGTISYEILTGLGPRVERVYR